MIGDYLIIDGHVHTFMSESISMRIQEAFNKLYEIEFKNSGPSTIEDVLNNMRNWGIDFTIMANFAPPKIIHNNNMWTLEVSKEFSNLIPLVSFHPDMEENMCELLETYVEQGARGVKLHPMAQGFIPDHPNMQSLYSLCNELKLPVVFHCGRVANCRLNEFADVDMIEPVVKKYKDIRVIFTHMADGNVDDVLRLSKLYENVYFDTSIVITGAPSLIEKNKPSWLNDELVVEVINEIGAEKVVFGSDYPWGNPKYDISRIMKLQLDKEQKKLIFGENASRVFKI